MKKAGVIYLATTPSGHKYVGQTIDFKERMWAHKSSSKNKNAVDYNCLIHSAMRKYKDKINWQIIISDVLKEDLNELEEMMIAHYDTYKNGLNMTPGQSYPTVAWSKRHRIKNSLWEMIYIMKTISNDCLFKATGKNLLDICENDPHFCKLYSKVFNDSAENIKENEDILLTMLKKYPPNIPISRGVTQ